MLLKYFNSNRISVFLFIVLLPAAYWIPSFFPAAHPPVLDISGGPLGKLILRLSHEFRLISSLLALALVMVNGYLLIQLNTIHIFIPVRTRLSAYFYAVLVAGMTQLHQLTPALVASSILVLVLFRIFSTYKLESISLNYLDAGILISLASMVYFPALAFFLFLIAGMLMLRPFIWREWAFAIIGLIIPYLFLISGYYLLDIPFSGYVKDVADSFSKTDQEYKLSQIVNWAFVLAFVMIGSYYMVTAIDSMKIHARKFFLIFLIYFLLSVIIYLILPGAGIGMIYFVSVPLAYLFTYFFVKCRQHWINELFFLIFLILLLWQRF